ncbi:N-acetylmuramoyl-L-alanine amidase [Streptococcus macedonicus]|uniref:N-acetylmuramoyl-L-alanine amidase n=1 Tax=Streptococcus macedonicus TaxID=59310 RepID=A0A1C3SPM7_STRMC|nr:glucosaminidase domain-containing protein [Streptococcus macedonicus]MBT1048000.1 glucosaminidase domain-containing protein [Streptococcus macedonicus]PHV56488.1 N-acetylmuramoyl-L-alanine amidase [Streptococcus macedonicus]PHV58534.1 N-acetylmuramoyl-L-alanine amidase [Streptococcus macedonicus]PHV60871.1 N-acetylmuramoyl-L-alanine amidase [Streptococcus macedonicus]
MTDLAKTRKRKVIKKARSHRRQKKVPKWALYGMSLLTVLACVALVIFTYQAQDADNTATADTTSSTTISDQITINFIESIGESARQIAAQNDLYASVMIAQAILESDSGQSALSQAPNYNFFGIKGDYNGQSVTMKTWEDDGSGNTYTIDAQFRSYGSQAESLEDYAQFLQKDIYAGVHKSNTTSYKDATAALTGTYATDTSYGTKLNRLIEQYGLTVYDSW